MAAAVRCLSRHWSPRCSCLVGRPVSRPIGRPVSCPVSRSVNCPVSPSFGHSIGRPVGPVQTVKIRRDGFHVEVLAGHDNHVVGEGVLQPSQPRGPADHLLLVLTFFYRKELIWRKF